MSQDTSPDKATNISWQHDVVGRLRREQVAGHRGAVLWLTGLSAAGKTTIARGLEAALVARGVRVYVLDAENVRHGLNSDLGFSPADRAEHVRRLGEVAKLFADAATVCVVANIAPYRAMRAALRDVIGADYHEIYVAAPLSVCEDRDPRGLYARARAGDIPSFTGVSAPYEPPTAPELVIRSQDESVDASVGHLLDYLEAKGLLTPSG